MRALLWIVVAIAGIWAGFWLVASTAVELGAESWFADQTARGMVAEKSALSVQGFPNRVDLTIEGLTLADPARGFGWKAPFVQVLAMTWKPWHLIAALPHEQVFSLPNEDVMVQTDRFMASLLLHPGPALALNEAVVKAEAVKLTSTLGWMVLADKVVISSREAVSAVNAHRLGLEVTGLVPDEGLLAALKAQPGINLPDVLEEIHVDATAGLTAALDRHAGETRPQLQSLDLAEARLVWGAFKVEAKGNLSADAEGYAAGTISIRVENWRILPPILAATGVIAPDFAPTLARGLEVLAKAGTDPDVLELPLKAAGGRMSLGPIPLGKAPVFLRDRLAPAG